MIAHRRSARMRRSVILALFVVLLAVPSSAAAATLSIAPTDDAFVRANQSGTNFGTADFLDSHGGLSTFSCGSDGVQTGPAYAYLRFDVSGIPADAVINSVELRLTSRTGYAWDGDPFQHIRFVGDDSWSEGTLTYANRPTDVVTTDLASLFIHYAGSQCGDPKLPLRPHAFSDATLKDRVGTERDGDGTLSVQVFNNNCPTCTVRPNGGYWVRFFSKEAADAGVRPQLVVDYHLPAPTLYDSATANGTTDVAGRIAGIAGTDYTVDVYASTTCDDGALGADRTLLGSRTVTPGPGGEGLFSVSFANPTPSASFVAATVRRPGVPTSDLSRCVPENDAWTRARTLSLTGPAGSTVKSANVSQRLDLEGQARWYRFDVQPNSKVTVDLTSLPANYDVFVFKDIGAALNSVSTTDDLTLLSAEFAGASVAPSAFSPSAFSPSAFSPSAFSPSAFSPSAFSPSAFSPSAFSPSAFSPSAFSPSAFSPSAFSPSAFSPSAFSPDAYSSAQVRSLVAASTNDGIAPESVTLNSWGNSHFYVRVSGRGGASSPAAPFNLHVSADGGVCAGIGPIGSAPPDAAGRALKTVILTDPSRMSGTATEKSTMLSKLQALAARPEVAGQIVDLAQNSRVGALNAQADAHNGCPHGRNLVAGAVKDIIDSYRANNPGLKYVVVVGNDRAVPFFRYPDTAGLGPESGYVPPVLDSSASQASLRLDNVLSQDAYGSRTQVSLKDSEFPVPDLAVGRLVESPTTISRQLDNYLATSGGVVPTPTSSLVTGYDFLTDAANAVQSDLSAGLGTASGVRKDTLITDADVPPSEVGDPPRRSWDAARLRAQLLGSRHDLMFLAGHFSANNALAADYETTLNSTELAASSVNLTNSIVVSAGCHSGYNIVDQDAVEGVTVPLDWAEAFANKGAALIAGTGYQYGDTDFLEYSERLYSYFARELRVGSGAVPIGSALVQAKQDYLETTPLLRGIHQKAVLESTLFGLPMLSVNLPAGRITEPAPTSIVSSTTAFGADPGATLGLRYADVSLTPATTEVSKTLTNLGGGTTTATYLQGPDGVLTNPTEPALPLARSDVSVPGRVLRGVGFRGGTFDDTPGKTPLTGAATTELQAVHTPFASSVFFPLRLWSVNYFDALGGPGGRTNLTVTPAQYKSDGPGSLTDTLRRYSGLDLRLYYSNETQTYDTAGGAAPQTPALAAPPTIVRVADSVDQGKVTFRVNVVGDPSAGIQEVWITYSGVHAGKWEALDLQQDATDSTLWTGTLTLPSGVSAGDVSYVVQAVNGVGLASLDDNFGRYYAPAAVAVDAPPPAATALTLESPPASGVNGADATVTATLTSGGAPLAGKPVTFTIGSSTRTATTGDDGRATASVRLIDLPGSYRLSAAFTGDGRHAPSSAGPADFTITRQPMTLTLSPASSTLSEAEPGPTATLTGGGAPLAERALLFVLTKAEGSVVARFTRITDLQGRARIGSADVPAGTYTLTAYFGGMIALPMGSITLGDPIPYDAVSATATVQVVASIVFTSQRDGNEEVYSVRSDGTGLRRLTNHAASDRNPAWSPDRSRIAFVSKRDGNLEIYTMAADGSDLRRVTQSSANDVTPVWSPDGTRIAFASDRSGNFELYTARPDGGDLFRVTTSARSDLTPSWSPDGGRIAFSSDRTGDFELYSAKPDGSSVLRLTKSSKAELTPAWSPDGKKIAFSSDRSGNFELYSANADGTGVVRLTSHAAEDVTAAWSPDGGRLVFSSDRAGNFELYNMAAAGGTATRVTTAVGFDGQPYW